jgi:hypothetical protein
MLPVREAGQDDPVEVGEDRLEALGRLGRRGAQPGAYGARLDAGHDGVLGGPGAVVGDPVDDLVAEAAELLGVHRGPYASRSRRRVSPPSIVTTCPVTYESGSSRKRTARATSSGRPKRGMTPRST